MLDTPWTCPYCGSRMKKWRVPDGASWDAEFFMVCFDDECSYYRDGWTWMREQFQQEASYRYAVDPREGQRWMIPVWSPSATKEMIVDESVEGAAQ